VITLISNTLYPGVMKRPRFCALIFVAVLLGAASRSVGIGDRVVLWSLIKDSDAIIDGTVVDKRPVDNGVWHKVQINDIVWGETPEAFVDVFVYGPDVPESVALYSEDRGIMGLRWITAEGGSFEQELLKSADDILGSAALVAVDAVVFEDDADERANLAESIRIITTAVRDDDVPGEATLREVAGLLDNDSAIVRQAVIRTLNELDAEIPPSVVPDLQAGFEEEVRVHQDEDVLRSFFDIVRNKDLPVDPEAICQVIVGHEKINLVNEGIEALNKCKSDDVLSTLLTHYPTGTPGERGRIIRALSRLGWSGVVSLCEQAFESDDWHLHVSAIESLGNLESEESTVLLIETTEVADWPLRKLTLESLTRQRTTHSYRALHNLIGEDGLFDTERRFIERNLSNPRDRLKRRLKN
jgi:hypothetical protein